MKVDIEIAFRILERIGNAGKAGEMQHAVGPHIRHCLCQRRRPDVEMIRERGYPPMRCQWLGAAGRVHGSPDKPAMSGDQ